MLALLLPGLMWVVNVSAAETLPPCTPLPKARFVMPTYPPNIEPRGLPGPVSVTVAFNIAKDGKVSDALAVDSDATAYRAEYEKQALEAILATRFGSIPTPCRGKLKIVFKIPELTTPMADLDAWTAARLMGRGINIGNTLENTTTWETGWGNPKITKEYVDGLAKLGFKVVRLPVAWDTYARDGQIQPEKLARVGEVVDWITAAGMFCVLNIHWDGGWIDSSNKERFSKTFATFSADAERKFPAYWTQIATYFADRDEHLLFEALNEETNFENAGSTRQAYATLTRVNQLFIDTVRKTGGNNARRLLVVTGYGTDITKTTSTDYVLPTDTVPHKLLISVHYYTPWQFVGMTQDESWGKMRLTWGSKADVAELNRLLDAMQAFSKKHDLPVFIGEFGVTDKKEQPSRVRWMLAVAQGALARKMVPVLWDTGGDVSRRPPYAASPALTEVLQALPKPN